MKNNEKIMFYFTSLYLRAYTQHLAYRLDVLGAQPSREEVEKMNEMENTFHILSSVLGAPKGVYHVLKEVS